ncbi:MAG: RHS repeat protein [Pirellulales bacterium]
MYDPKVGRFITEDPIGFDGGDANLSRYVGNAPTNATDPKGLWEIGGDPTISAGTITRPRLPWRKTPSGLEAGTLEGGLVPRPAGVSAGHDLKTPWPVWLRRHNLEPYSDPILFGCGGLVAIRADKRVPPHLKPGTKCTTVWEDAIDFLAEEQRQGRRPLLIAVQTSYPLAVRATPGSCDLDGQELGLLSENFLAWLGRNKWEAFWEGASGPPRYDGKYVIETTTSNPFGIKQTFFCIVQNPYNWSPDVR